MKTVTEESQASIQAMNEETIIWRLTKGRQVSECYPSFISISENYIQKAWFVEEDGMIVHHREGGPAVYERGYQEDGEVETYHMWWYRLGKLHRERGPAVSISYLNHEAVSPGYPWHRLLHRMEGPASTVGCCWYRYGHLHRESGPAVVSEDGCSQYWYVCGVLHRVGGPAVVTPEGEKWYIHGVLHRTDGPAVNRMGQEAWYINGKLVDTPL